MFGACAGSEHSQGGSKGLSVFCVDPGETTGWAWACVSYRELRSIGGGSGGSGGDLSWGSLFARLIDSGRFDCGQVEVYRGPLSSSSVAARVAMQEAMACVDLSVTIEQLHILTQGVSRGSVSQVTDIVIEDFILRQGTKARNLLAPVRLTAGLVQEVLRSNRLIGVTMQSPSDAKSVVTDDRLRSLGLWQVGQVHARDACRHLALFLRRLVAE